MKKMECLQYQKAITIRDRVHKVKGVDSARGHKNTSYVYPKTNIQNT